MKKNEKVIVTVVPRDRNPLEEAGLGLAAPCRSAAAASSHSAAVSHLATIPVGSLIFFIILSLSALLL